MNGAFGVAPGAVASSVESSSADARASALRLAIVGDLVAAGDVVTPRVRQAMLAIPRHWFVPSGTSLESAYANRPLPIGFGQTISQPAIVARMTEALELDGSERVLEIGTGSGYQAAVLSLLAAEVYTVERVPELAERAQRLLSALGLRNVHVRHGDGYDGWRSRAPFDRVLVTAAPPFVPRPLVDQLAEGGALVAPIGDEPWSQRLVRIRKVDGLERLEDLADVSFVPMVHADHRG